MLLQAFYEESKKKWSYHKILISLIYFVFIILGFMALLALEIGETPWIYALSDWSKNSVTEGKFCPITF